MSAPRCILTLVFVSGTRRDGPSQHMLLLFWLKFISAFFSRRPGRNLPFLGAKAGNCLCQRAIEPRGRAQAIELVTLNKARKGLFSPSLDLEE